MSHTLTFSSGSTITVYVDGYNDDLNPIIVEHQILDAQYTTLQYLGAKSPVRNFSFSVYGGVNAQYIQDQILSGTIFLYTDDTGASGSYVGKDPKKIRRQALNYSDTWWSFTMKGVLQLGSGSPYYTP